MIKQEFDGMKCDEYSEPFEYTKGPTDNEEQPYVKNNCDDVFGYCLGVCDGTCVLGPGTK